MSINGISAPRPEIAYLASTSGPPVVITCHLTDDGLGYRREDTGEMVPTDVVLSRSHIDAAIASEKAAGWPTRAVAGALHPSRYPSRGTWESAVASMFGGVYSQWPAWAQAVRKRPWRHT